MALTQTEQVIAHLRSRGSRGLTPLEALDALGIFRLASRIHDAKELIGADEEIVTERVTNGDTGKTFARYVLRAKVAPEGRQATIW